MRLLKFKASREDISFKFHVVIITARLLMSKETCILGVEAKLRSLTKDSVVTETPNFKRDQSVLLLFHTRKLKKFPVERSILLCSLMTSSFTHLVAASTVSVAMENTEISIPQRK